MWRCFSFVDYLVADFTVLTCQSLIIFSKPIVFLTYLLLVNLLVPILRAYHIHCMIEQVESNKVRNHKIEKTTSVYYC